MRTSQKRDILEMIATLHEAHDVVRNNIEAKQYASAQAMLSQCQECAVRMGTAIEESEGEGFVTVSHIETYCEVLYRIYQELDENGDVSANKTRKTLEKYMLKIENSAKHDLTARKEMVFLPYKSSMWDSLESVWRAAVEDPECDAYVVPIPYYDKNPDGTFSKAYYEGDEFPADVPVTHYNDYDFETRHPDAIFIHNPYDHGNYVTSVHPYFYSDKLKQYCDKLIYIPYYVSAEVGNPDDPVMMEAKSGFILTFGLMNADMVIVQSENTKKLYINVLRKELPDIPRNYWENKIFGFGSPKLDRVNRIQRDDDRLPENWKKIIYNENGIRKKTILYNVSVSTLLKNPEMIDKIKDVLDFFKENTDVALWWRPHPLYESTLASMRPEMLDEYKKVVSAYKEGAWGIFDEGVDLEWAIAETDAYYGDGSSVVQLYKEVKKPIMFQNVWVRAKREVKAEDIPIWPSAFCVDGDDIWFVHGKMKVLMRYSMSEKYTYVIGVIPNAPFFVNISYRGVYKWKNRIFLIPCWAREIVFYDIAERKFGEMPLQNIEKYEGKTLFHRVYSLGKYLYCIPDCYGAILKIDMDSCNIEHIDISKVLEEKGYDISQIYINDSTKADNELIALVAYTNLVLHYNMESGTIQVSRLGNSDRQFTSIANIEKHLYLFDKETRTIIKVSREEHSDEREVFTVMHQALRMNTVQPGLIILDSNDNEIQIMDLEEKIVFDCDDKQDKQLQSLKHTYKSGIEGIDCMNNNHSYYFNMSAYRMYKFNEGKIDKQFSMELKIDELNKLKGFFFNVSDPIVSENDLYNLGLWTANMEMGTPQNTPKKNCGERILQTVKAIF